MDPVRPVLPTYCSLLDHDLPLAVAFDYAAVFRSHAG